MEMLNRAIEDASAYKEFEKQILQGRVIEQERRLREWRGESTPKTQVQVDESLIRYDGETRAQYRERTRRARAALNRRATQPIKA